MDDIQKRAVLEAEYLLKNKSTVRDTGDYFGISKSTVHLDVTKRLIKINPRLQRKVQKVLDKNWNEKHIRGGNSTKQKWLEL